MDLTACTEPQCLYNGALHLYLYLYSPYGPYGLYTASVPVQRCTLTLPIPLLPLRAVRPVQILSACTTVHFTFTNTSTPPMGRTACTEPQCLYNGALYLYLYLYSPVDLTACTEPQGLYNGALYLYLYLYSPYGPYGLYRASVPVQGCTLTLPIPLLPLWTLRPVQSLSACTRVHFTFTYTSTPLWTLRPVQSLSACTRVHFTFTYTSTPPMDLTACTEPQCLYRGAL